MGKTMKKHFVTFYTPDTFVAIDSWDIDLAVSACRKINARHGALPYGFQFSTRECDENGLDSHETEISPFYYLGGEVFTIEQLKESGNPDDRSFISDMERNGWNKMIVNTNSRKFVQPLRDSDVVLPFATPNKAQT